MCDNKCYRRYLKQEGWVKLPQPKKPNGTKYTAREYCLLRQSIGNMQNLIIHLGTHHVAAIIGGKVNDTWDSTDGCVGVIYAKA